MSATTNPSPPPPRRGGGTLRAASAISAATLVSRILGLVRDGMMTHILGATWAMGTFTLAWMVPNLLRRLFGEGALSASLIPALARTQSQDPARTRDLLAGVAGGLLVGLSALSLVVAIGCLVVPPEWLGLRGDGGVSAHERGRLLLDLLLILFPYCIPICLTAAYAGAQNVLGSFTLPAIAPAMLNVIWIGGLVAVGKLDLAAREATLVIAGVLLVGGVAQLALSVVPLARQGFVGRPRLPRRGDASAAVFVAMTPTVLGLSLTQLNVIVDQALAEYLVGAGSNTHIYLANRLLLFPHALTALAVATAVFPSLSRLAGEGDLPGLRRKLDLAVRGTVLLAVPAAVGIIAVGGELVSIAFVHGKYTQADAGVTALTLTMLVVGLPFLSTAQLYARALYALGDTRSPAVAAAALLVGNVSLNLVFVLGFGMGTEGLTLATSLASAGNSIWLRRKLAARLPGGDASLGPLLRTLVATAGMYGVVVLAREMFAATGRMERTFLHLLWPMAAGMAAFAGLHFAAGGRELADILRRRFARRRR